MTALAAIALVLVLWHPEPWLTERCRDVATVRAGSLTIGPSADMKLRASLRLAKKSEKKGGTHVLVVRREYIAQPGYPDRYAVSLTGRVYVCAEVRDAKVDAEVGD